jgi:hypothetical protein
MQTGRDALRAELTAIAAPFLQAVARVRTYKKAVLRSLAARDEDFVAVWELWGDLGTSFDEPSVGIKDRMCQKTKFRLLDGKVMFIVFALLIVLS